MRPTTYTDELVEQARSYVDNYKAEGEIIPTVVGLCKYIKRGKTTVYNWLKDDDKEEFRDIVSEIEEYQHIELLNGGLSGGFNPMISKLILGRHGYTDKVAVDDKPGNAPKNFNAFYDE